MLTIWNNATYCILIKVYQTALEKSTDFKMIMERHPILSLIAYLMAKGSSLEVANTAGKTGGDVVLSKGLSTIIVKMLIDLLVISLVGTSGGVSCMGSSSCNRPPAFHLHCPHKPGYTACSKCFLLKNEKKKCGCPEEDVTSIQPAAVQELMGLSRIQAEMGQPDLASYDLKWNRDKSSNYGFLRDQMGNKYTWIQSGVGYSHRYRCDHGNYKERCTAIARRFKNEDGTTSVCILESSHNHPTTGFKRKIDEENQSEGKYF